MGESRVVLRWGGVDPLDHPDSIGLTAGRTAAVVIGRVDRLGWKGALLPEWRWRNAPWQRDCSLSKMQPAGDTRIPVKTRASC